MLQSLILKSTCMTPLGSLGSTSQPGLRKYKSLHHPLKTKDQPTRVDAGYVFGSAFDGPEVTEMSPPNAVFCESS